MIVSSLDGHPSSVDSARCCWTSCSVIPFPAVTHPTVDRARCCLTFFFDCLLFRRSPIQVPNWHGSPGLHLRLSRFPVGTHPTADRTRCCLTLFFDCLLFRWSPTQVLTRPGAAGLHLRLSPFRRSPIRLPTFPGAAGLHLRLSPFRRSPIPVFFWRLESLRMGQSGCWMLPWARFGSIFVLKGPP